jgi:hypothetical protein
MTFISRFGNLIVEDEPVYKSENVFPASSNGTNLVLVTTESDFGTVVGGAITLTANTTYFVRGSVSCANRLVLDSEGILITGQDRNIDKLIYTGALTFITSTDVNFSITSIFLSSTNSASLLLSATNVTAGEYNIGRLKVIELVNVQFRNCFNVLDINGYDLVDIQNCLFFYIKAPSIGLRFRDTSKIEITSCELIRWFDETTIPTPSGWATCSMIELQNNNLASFGAVNINGCIIHPQQTQNGIDIGTGSTTGFGTISSNAFVNAGLTTGSVFLPIIPVLLLPDYSQTATYGYDVLANQGILNSTSGCVMTFVGNTTNTSLTSGIPTIINTGGLASAQASVRFTISGDGRARYNGTKQVYVSIHGTVSYDKQGGGSDDYVFYLYLNGAVLPESATTVRGGGDASELSTSLTYGTLLSTNDLIQIYVENTGSNDDILIRDCQLLIRE